MTKITDTSFSLVELLDNFQEALRAIVPMADKIGMAWKNDEAYDEWEEFEASLFNGFVVKQLIYDQDVRRIKPFVPYKTSVRSLQSYSYIQHLDERAWIFLGLRTREAPFDSCWLQAFDQSGLETTNELKLLALRDLNLQAMICSTQPGTG